VSYAFDPALAPWAQSPDATPLDFSDPAAARAAMRAMANAQAAERPPSPVDVHDALLPARQGETGVTVRVYRPHGETEPLPALLHFHWGGLVSGDLDTNHDAALRLAEQVRTVVVSVDYRLAPEHPYPHALDDGYAALEWTVERAGELGVDAERVGVFGESAGGGLAAALALLARDRGEHRLCCQALYFPGLDDRMGTPSARAFHDTPVLNRAAVHDGWRHYLGGVAPGAPDVPAYAAPARAADLSGLPPAFLAVCEFDPLRDENLLYGRRLIEAGVACELRHYPGTFHACTALPGADVVTRMIDDGHWALRRMLHGGTA
jgi:acetyl esterase/lipase